MTMGETEGRSKKRLQFEHRYRRQYLQSIVGLASAIGVGGCSSDDVNPPEQVTETSGSGGGDKGGNTPTGSGNGAGSGGDPQESTATSDQSTPRTAEAALGDVIEGDNLALVAYDVERTTSLGEFTSADAGNEFVVIDMAAKNKASEEYISFSSFLQVTLRDSEAYEYEQAITGSGNTLDSGELAPGEVTRGVIVFEVPQGTSGLTLHVDLDESIFSYSGAIIDLGSLGSGRTLTQNLRVDIYDVGETLEYQTTRFTVNEVRTSVGSGFASPESGNEFVIVNITVENTGSEELSVSTLLQMELKDAQGFTYSTSLTATSALDQGFAQGQPIAPRSRRRGEIAFEVEQGLSPLYLMMDFDIFAEGDKTFFQLR